MSNVVTKAVLEAPQTQAKESELLSDNKVYQNMWCFCNSEPILPRPSGVFHMHRLPKHATACSEISI